MYVMALQLNADEWIRLSLEEDITSEDITSNSVIKEYQKGTVDLMEAGVDYISSGV